MLKLVGMYLRFSNFHIILKKKSSVFKLQNYTLFYLPDISIDPKGNIKLFTYFLSTAQSPILKFTDILFNPLNPVL